MRVLHFIDDLGHGGAEILLMKYIPKLTEYKHTVVTFRNSNVYSKEGYEYIPLQLQAPKDIIKIIRETNKIIRNNRIDIVHSHSYWTNIVTRFLTVPSKKIFNHYHFADYDTLRNKTKLQILLLLDRLTYKKNITLVAVSDYIHSVLKKEFYSAKIATVPNFIICYDFKNNPITQNESNDILRIVTIGNCNMEKNYDTIISAFDLLKNENVSIDIFGGGGMLEKYKLQVKNLGLSSVRFLGQRNDILTELPKYDLYLSASFSESFGISVLEAMCAGLPLLLSDIPAFKEIAPQGSVFFDTKNPSDLIIKIKTFQQNKSKPDCNNYKKTLEKYSVMTFLNKLIRIYSGDL